MNDVELAGHLATETGRALVELRQRRIGSINPWSLRDEGDLMAHRYIADRLAELRPSDTLFSEEGTEQTDRLVAERTWIVDPLDGTHDFPNPDSPEWAVHIALVEGGEGGRATAAAVSIPAFDTVHHTGSAELAPRPDRDGPVIVTGRSNAWPAMEVADELDGQVVACGSSGFKAMLVVAGTVDAYIHTSGLWEWDVCAPAEVSRQAGAVVTDATGNPIVYNKRRPTVPGLVVVRPEWADRVLGALNHVL